MTKVRIRSIFWFCLLAIQFVAAIQCSPRSGMNQRQCSILARFGCPVRFLGKGCTASSGMLLRDGGCQPTNACSFCCKQSCYAAKKIDSSCQWSPSSQMCFRCWKSGVFDNGTPAIPGATALLPADWGVYGLGDSFTVYPTCNSNAEFITGVNFWLAETDPAKASAPLTDIPVRIVFFHQASGFTVAEWTGECSSFAFLGKTPKLAGMYTIRRVFCDFRRPDLGTILNPGPCSLPALPQGTYDILFQHSGSPTLGWVQSLQSTGCNTGTCSFSQQMASVVLPRFDICSYYGPRLQNFAFQILGTSVRPVIPGC